VFSKKMLGDDALCIVVHDDRHAVHPESVCLGHHALAEAVGDVVRAQQTRKYDVEVDRDDRERDGKPPAEDDRLKVDVPLLAPGEDAAGIARLADSRLDKGTEVAAAPEGVLDAEAADSTKVAGPLVVDLALEVEGLGFVIDVTRDERRRARA
jgi:hypothetical protein